MIFEYSRSAKCKDCLYCGYYYPKKKDGLPSRLRRHKCKLTEKDVLLSNSVCGNWEMGCGEPGNYDYIITNQSK